MQWSDDDMKQAAALESLEWMYDLWTLLLRRGPAGSVVRQVNARWFGWRLWTPESGTEVQK